MPTSRFASSRSAAWWPILSAPERGSDRAEDQCTDGQPNEQRARWSELDRSERNPEQGPTPDDDGDGQQWAPGQQGRASVGPYRPSDAATARTAVADACSRSSSWMDIGTSSTAATPLRLTTDGSDRHTS